MHPPMTTRAVELWVPMSAKRPLAPATTARRPMTRFQTPALMDGSIAPRYGARDARVDGGAPLAALPALAARGLPRRRAPHQLDLRLRRERVAPHRRPRRRADRRRGPPRARRVPGDLRRARLRVHRDDPRGR